MSSIHCCGIGQRYQKSNGYGGYGRTVLINTRGASILDESGSGLALHIGKGGDYWPVVLTRLDSSLFREKMGIARS